MRFTEEIFDDFFRVCAEEKVEGIEVSGKPAVKYLDSSTKPSQSHAQSRCGSPRVKTLSANGYDAVIAAGIEEGGHPLSDDVTTMVLVPRIAESVNIPVISTAE
jgi:nitronate monooxygenase